MSRIVVFVVVLASGVLVLLVLFVLVLLVLGNDVTAANPGRALALAPTPALLLQKSSDQQSRSLV
jgi:hypothetical protein